MSTGGTIALAIGGVVIVGGGFYLYNKAENAQIAAQAQQSGSATGIQAIFGNIANVGLGIVGVATGAGAAVAASQGILGSIKSIFGK